MKKPPTGPAPTRCIYEHPKEQLPDANKRRMSKTSRSSYKNESTNFIKLDLTGERGDSETETCGSDPLVSKAFGSRCGKCVIM